MMTEQVECYRCQVWLDDFQTKVIDGDDYCCECAFAVLDIENERLQAANAALLEACEYALRETVRPSSDPLIKALKEAIRKASP